MAARREVKTYRRRRIVFIKNEKVFDTEQETVEEIAAFIINEIKLK